MKLGLKGTEMSQMQLNFTELPVFLAVEACESNSQLYNDITLHRLKMHVIYV